MLNKNLWKYIICMLFEDEIYISWSKSFNDSDAIILLEVFIAIDIMPLIFHKLVHNFDLFF